MIATAVTFAMYAAAHWTTLDHAPCSLLLAAMGDAVVADAGQFQTNGGATPNGDVQMESNTADMAQPNPASVVGFPHQLQNSATSQKRRSLRDLADTALKSAAGFWFLVTVIGQMVFGFYILSFYGGSAVQGNLAAWNQVLPHGYIPGDAMGNIVIATHLFLAAVITIGGPLQLVPQIRARAPSFHRWNGRIYLFTAFIAAITGLYMIWIRGGTVGDVVQHLGISLNAVLIMFCGAMALRYALARKFSIHRRWALRLFLLVSGVWFFRLGLFLWLIVNQGPAGFDPKTFQGPFLSFLSFAQYLVPLVALEIYLRAQDRAGTTGRFAVATGLLVLTVAMGVGIFGATMGLWLPRI